MSGVRTAGDGCGRVVTTVLADDRRSVLRRRIRLLTATTITYNVIEGVIALAAGTVVGSVALIGFGLDSVIEVISAVAVAWQFAGRDPEGRERTALRVISWSFFALAAYVTVESVRALLGAGEAERSVIGLALVATSVVVMPFLSLAQRRAGQELGSASAVADSKQTLLCTYLSVAVLVGLALNAGFGWWWADPAAGLVLAVLAVREGVKARRGDSCCTPVRMTEDLSCRSACGDLENVGDGQVDREDPEEDAEAGLGHVGPGGARRGSTR